MSLTIDARRTALVMIDLQQGIVGYTLAPHTGAAVVANNVRLGQALHDAGGVIVPVHVAFSADEGDRLKQAVDQAMQRPATAGASWSEFVPEVAALPAAVRITKRQWSAFHGTELDLQLRRRGIDTIILGGISTNYGVESTARDAWQHGYTLLIAEDACSSSDAEAHAFAVRTIFPRLSRTRSTDEIVSAIRAGRA